jgi:hypothetical protein
MPLLRTATIVLLLAICPAFAQAVSESQLKAAYLINFAKLATWPNLAPSDPITFCTTGDDELAAAMTAMIPGQRVNGHTLLVSQPKPESGWASCQLLFVGRAGSDTAVRPLGATPDTLLTVSDEKGFASHGGMIELFTDGARLRFAVNLRQVAKSRVVLSSHLLQLARIVGDGRAR